MAPSCTSGIAGIIAQFDDDDPFTLYFRNDTDPDAGGKAFTGLIGIRGGLVAATLDDPGDATGVFVLSDIIGVTSEDDDFADLIDDEFTGFTCP